MSGKNDDIQDEASQNDFLEKSIPIHFEVVLEKRRWFILFGLMIFSFSNAVAYSTFSLILVETKNRFDIDTDLYIELFNVYFYGYIICSVPFAIFLSDHFAACMITGALFNMVGGILRWTADRNYGMMLAGQICAAIANGSLPQLPAVVAEKWFGPEERNWAVLLTMLGGFSGWAYGNLSPCVYMEIYASREQEGYSRMLLHQMIAMIIPVILIIPSIRNRPRTPPSVGTLVKQDKVHPDVLMSLKSLFKNRHYLIDVLCFSVIVSISYVIATVSSYILEPLNLSNLQLAYVGTSYLIIGISGSIIGVLYMERCNITNFDNIIKVLLTLGFVGMIGLAIVRDKAPFWVLLALNGLAGLGYISSAPFLMQSIVETSFPISESISVTVLMLTCQIFGYVGNKVTTIEVVGSSGYLILAGASLPVLIYALFGFKTRFRRARLESKHLSKALSCSLQNQNENPSTLE